jgi:hypothetical protein
LLLDGDRRDVRPCSFFSIVFFGGIIINGGVRELEQGKRAGASPDGAKNRLIEDECLLAAFDVLRALS